ncbi:portal protein [Akkermansia sp.]|uniref:portal protein n=1 Tax=Akkermansia sp. TaxID=1872421 RepID=UPI0025BFC749|nr:portal protein [Akkermansia sp.]MCD8272415.1 portal protein [Akkermansia sp.]
MALDITRLQTRYEELRLERSGFIEVYREVAQLFAPGRYRDDTASDYHLRAYPIDSKLVNSTGVIALRTMASGLHGGMTSPARPWFRLILQGNPSEIPDGVNAWLDFATQAMQTVLHQSNFYSAVHGLYADLGAFGIGLLVETADEDGIHFHLCNPGEFVIDINNNNEVDTFYRRMHMTARQIVDKFDDKNVPDFIKGQCEHTRNATARYDVIHAVFPRSEFKTYARVASTDKPYASVYFLLGSSSSSTGELSGLGGKPTILEEGGYDMFPAFAPRWDISNSDRYGTSPAMQVLPDCKMLQAMTTTLRKLQHKAADPPLVVDQSLRATGVRLTPGGLSYFDSTRTGITPVAPVHQPDAQTLQYSMQAIQEVEEIIKEGMYTELFRTFLDDERHNVTATEVSARQSEKLILLGPVLERLHKEFLQPVIQRTFALMREWGALPPPPNNVDILNIDVAFESVLAQAQRAGVSTSIEQGIVFVGNLAQMAPEALDLLDADNTVRAYLDRVAAPASMLREQDEVDSIRQQRAKQLAQQQQMAMGNQALAEAGALADAAKTMSETKVEQTSLLDSLLKGG